MKPVRRDRLENRDRELSRPVEVYGGMNDHVLHVRASWANRIIATRQYPPGGGPVTLGSGTGNRLYLLGRPVAWVEEHWYWLAALGPFVDVVEERRAHFFVPSDELPMATHPLFEWWEDGWECTVPSGWKVEPPIAVREGRLESVRLEPYQSVRIDTGTVCVEAELAPPEPRIKRRWALRWSPNA